jgi:hypothetical protein
MIEKYLIDFSKSNEVILNRSLNDIHKIYLEYNGMIIDIKNIEYNVGGCEIEILTGEYIHMYSENKHDLFSEKGLEIPFSILEHGNRLEYPLFHQIRISIEVTDKIKTLTLVVDGKYDENLVRLGKRLSIYNAIHECVIVEKQTMGDGYSLSKNNNLLLDYLPKELTNIVAEYCMSTFKINSYTPFTFSILCVVTDYMNYENMDNILYNCNPIKKVNIHCNAYLDEIFHHKVDILDNHVKYGNMNIFNLEVQFDNRYDYKDCEIDIEFDGYPNCDNFKISFYCMEYSIIIKASGMLGKRPMGEFKNMSEFKNMRKISDYYESFHKKNKPWFESLNKNIKL